MEEHIVGDGVVPTTVRRTPIFVFVGMKEEIQFTRVDATLVKRAAQVVDVARRAGLTISTAESCTGGLLSAVLSEAPGAGKQLQGGFVTYTKDQKTIALGIPRGLLDRESAVSEAVARAMAEGALARSIADISAAITGVAGPTPDEDGNPVGLVHMAAARRGLPTLHWTCNFGDIGRGAVRYQAVLAACSLLEECATQGEQRAQAAS
jgi:nicotinamide-nucleotide amidase